MKADFYSFARRFVERTDSTASPIRVGVLILLQRWIEWDLKRLRTKRKRILQRAAKEGKMLSVETIRTIMETSKVNYKGDNPDLYKSTVDQLLERLLQKYPHGIPVDEAHKLTEDGGLDKLLDS